MSMALTRTNLAMDQKQQTESFKKYGGTTMPLVKMTHTADNSNLQVAFDSHTRERTRG